MTLPAGIGIAPLQAGPRLYWLHNPRDRRLHPSRVSEPAALPLAQFFDVWGQPLSAASGRSPPPTGAVRVYVERTRY